MQYMSFSCSRVVFVYLFVVFIPHEQCTFANTHTKRQIQYIEILVFVRTCTSMNHSHNRCWFLSKTAFIFLYHKLFSLSPSEKFEVFFFLLFLVIIYLATCLLCDKINNNTDTYFLPIAIKMSKHGTVIGTVKLHTSP